MGEGCPGAPIETAQVFYTEVSALPRERLSRLTAFLSSDEQSRAARFVFPKDRLLFVAAHALLRSRLIAATGAFRLEFKVDRYGKPALNPPFGDPPLLFNLSHTNGLGACVLTRGCQVGIDAEEVVPRTGIEGIAQWAFTEEEQSIIAAKSGNERLEAFYRLWTLKEALVKGIGRGLSGDLKDIIFTLQPLTLRLAPRTGEDAACWRLQEFAPTPNHRIAVAVKVEACEAFAVTAQSISIAHLAADVAAFTERERGL
jgi:4'-phosphopantetheinyl transferase